VRLEVKGLRIARLPKHEINFKLRAGEIVGLAGLVGAGRTDIARALFGIDAAVAGNFFIDGKETPISKPQDAIAAGIAFVPEDRKAQGIIVEMPIRDNVVMAGLDKFNTAGFVNDTKITEVSNQMKTQLSVRTTDVFKPVGQLSGGNQQKVAIAKWLVNGPKVFLLDEPTRGVDVGAKSEIYGVIEKLAENGAAVLFISSELEEILRVSDRVLVMHEGRISGELGSDQLSEASVMQLATGTVSH
jgi:ribose transport system ATP-binding protein